MESRTCLVCRDLQELRSISYESIYCKALEGCPSCSLLLSVILRFFDRQEKIQSLTVQPGESNEKGPLILQVSLENGIERGIELYRQLGADGNVSEQSCSARCRRWLWPHIGFARPVSTHSASSESLSIMGEWLRDCVENHSDCPRNSISALPTRVLYVDPDSNKPRLVITDGEKGNYVALSHSWGSIMPLKLTTSTLHLYTSGISMETLPKTFQDAIIIAKNLCIDYIWIDSLCILQDSPGDWASESSRMADVYTNALVTIAADQSADCTGGIFAERGEEDAKSLPIQVASCSCSYCTVFARWRRRRIYPFANHAADHFPARSGLHSQGWTLQERLLSTRMLHFTPTELVWECTTQISCECRIAGLVPGQHLIFKRAFVHPIQESEASSHKMGGHIARRIHGALVDDVGQDHTLITQLHWQLVIYEFTARSLSVETDRLPALSGIANIICRRSSQTYYFGLLRAHAVRGLLWRSFDDRLETLKTKRMPKDYAPSWSFGSITGRIDFLPEIEYFRTFRQSVTIRFISKQLSSANPYGPGTGILSIEGYMVPICVEDPKHAGARRGSYRLFVVKTPSFESKNPPHDYPKNRPWGYFEPDVDGLEEISGGKPM